MIKGRIPLEFIKHSNKMKLTSRYFSHSYPEIKAKLPQTVEKFVLEKAKICQPENIHICDGSKEESATFIKQMVKQGVMKPLNKLENCYLTRTDPADVARVESKTFISTPNRRDTIPDTKEGIPGRLGNWMDPTRLQEKLNNRFLGSMKGRTMYVIPFSMGPVGGPLSKVGVELTDSPYVVASMKIMTRMTSDVLEIGGDFVKCLHSVGQPLPMTNPAVNNWPCNPEKTIISHLPEKNEIASFGSGYGGNSLLGKKCFALRLGSILARNEGWLAEHMLILGITNPAGKKTYIAAAFPSACGKTNMAMMKPTLPGYKVECVGDDIAWMKFDARGQLRAINPEAGFFGVAPGTSPSTNPHAFDSIQSNTLFTNVAETSEGGFYWEGLEKQMNWVKTRVTDWTNREWKPGCGRLAAHANSRFCTPASQCPIIDPLWESPEGVPISAIMFGGRRPAGVPLVYEAFSWRHGVFLGASMRSEATAAAENRGKVILHDPFAMRPFFGYNFGHYLKHWLSFEDNYPVAKLPRIFHVNWFRKGDDGKFLWPGFGENCRVLEWMLRRLEDEDCAMTSPVGHIPKLDSFNLEGMKEKVDMEKLFELPGEFWRQEAVQIKKYFNDQVGDDLPETISQELDSLASRVSNI